MPTDILQEQRTARTWMASGGDEVLTLTSLATAAGRKGDGHDWGASFAANVIVTLKTKFAVGPTSGNVLQVWWASSPDNTDFDGGLSAGDGAASDTDIIRQCFWIGNLVADNTTNAQQQSWFFRMPTRYGFPIVFNNSGQALGSTAGDHKLTIVPIGDEVQ